jgi:hypothetical protein
MYGRLVLALGPGTHCGLTASIRLKLFVDQCSRTRGEMSKWKSDLRSRCWRHFELSIDLRATCKRDGV